MLLLSSNSGPLSMSTNSQVILAKHLDFKDCKCPQGTLEIDCMDPSFRSAPSRPIDQGTPVQDKEIDRLKELAGLKKRKNHN